MWAIFKREFRSFFQSVTGWLFIAVTLGLFGLYFYVYNLFYGSPYLSRTLSAITFIMMVTVPILTMRILAEERKSRTDQLILTAPISVGKVVVGKYLSMAAVFTIPVLVMCITPLFLSIFGDISFGECYAAILGYWLFGLTCIAIGTFISSVTESQVIAAVLTFGILFLGYMMSSITGMISSTGNLLTKILNCYDLTSGMDDFFDGFFDVQALIYYVSLIALFLFLTVQSIQKRRWSISSKKIKTGVFSTGFIAIALVAAIAVNMAASQLPESIRTIDMTAEKLYTITDETEALLDTLEEDITIYVLAAEDNQDPTVQKTLQRYEAYSKHVKVVYKDPSVSPTFYKDYTDSKVTQNSLIVESSKRAKVIDYMDLYESETDYSTYQTTVTGYDAEGQLTSAISYVINDNTPVIYQVTGHDEVTISGSFSDAVTKLNATLKDLNLLENDEIPEDAQCLIINAPSKDFSADDVDKVLKYLEKGGDIVIVVGYTTEDMTNFEKLLDAYGVTAVDGIVMETDRNCYYTYPYYLLCTARYDDATENVSGDYIFMPYAIGMTYSEDESENIVYTRLLSTSDTAFSKVNVGNAESYEKEEGDIDGPFVLGLHAHKYTDDSENSSDAYIFSGNSTFTDSASEMVYGNNATLFAGVISQFTGNEVTSVVPVKSLETQNLTINQANVVVGGLAISIIVPIALLVIGIVIWARRRRK